MRSLQLAVAGALGLFLAQAQEIRITEGIADYQVFQRGADQTADIKLGGAIVVNKKTNGKDIEVRLTTGNRALSNFDWVPIGRAPAGKVPSQKWSGEVKGVPMGGPYRLEVRVQGGTPSFSVDNILVGDLWLLAGQSNMEGHGDLVDVEQPVPLVHSFDMADKWLKAEEPLHTLVSAADRVHWRLNENKEPERWTGERLDKFLTDRKKGAGLGLPFAGEMVRRTGIPVGLIPCAHGGTSMDQWSPALKDREGDSLYGSMLRRFRAAGGNVRGMLWYQGESDANPKAAPDFLRKFEDFVKAVRADFNEPNLPFYYVQIGRHVDGKNISEWNAVQSAQLAAEARLQNSAMVASIDCTLDDGIHVSTRDLKRIARRLADEASHDLFPRIKNYGDMKRGPRPLSARFDNGIVTVTFSSVNGRLEAEGRISGFSIHDEKGEPVPLIYRSAIDPAAASTVLLYVGGKPPRNATLRYGFGKDPYANLHDAMDQAVPAFGPLAIQ
jgi:sialate O-acetylesterase